MKTIEQLRAKHWPSNDSSAARRSLIALSKSRLAFNMPPKVRTKPNQLLLSLARVKFDYACGLRNTTRMYAAPDAVKRDMMLRAFEAMCEANIFLKRAYGFGG